MKRRNRGKTREEEEEKGAKNRALGDSTAKTEGRRERRAKRDYSTSIREKGADKANQTRRERRGEETKEKSRVPDRVKSFREVKGGKDSSKSGLRVAEAIGNHLREVGDIRFARAKRTEASLGVREKRAGSEKNVKRGRMSFSRRRDRQELIEMGR